MAMDAQGEQYGDNYKYGNAEFGGGENMKLRYGEIPLGEPEAITPGQSDVQGRVKYGAGYRGSSYQYDAYSRLEEYTDRFGNTFVYGYDQYSRLHTVTYPNSVVTTYSYDSAGRLESIVHSKSGQTLKSFTYQYDDNGNITKITYQDGSYIDYTYDQWNRLIDEHKKNSGGQSLYQIQYSFDNAAGDTGNIYQKIVTSNGSPETTTFTYDAYNKLTGITHPDSATETLTYDDNGQLITRNKSTGDTTTYEWNDQGFLRKVTLPSAEEVKYSYDGAGRLTGRKCGSQEDLFVQSGWDVVSQQDENKWRTHYTGMSMIDDSDSPKYFHYNHRGDTILVTDRDGNVIHDIYYEAYGTALNSSGTPLLARSLSDTPNLFVGFHGIRYDFKVNLNYMRFRWFSPDLSRFINFDTFIKPNRFAYVSDNPINYIDPFGLNDVYVGHFDKIDTQHVKQIESDIKGEGLKYKMEHNPGYDQIISALEGYNAVIAYGHGKTGAFGSSIDQNKIITIDELRDRCKKKGKRFKATVFILLTCGGPTNETKNWKDALGPRFTGDVISVSGDFSLRMGPDIIMGFLSYWPKEYGFWGKKLELKNSGTSHIRFGYVGMLFNRWTRHFLGKGSLKLIEHPEPLNPAEFFLWPIIFPEANECES